MAKKELVDYVEHGLKRGRHVRHIKRKLSHAGHPIQEIESAVRHVLLTKPHLKRARNRLFVGLFIVAAIVLSSVLLFTFEENEKIIAYQENVSHSQMSDELILRQAMELDDITGCKYARSEIARYACLERDWKKDDCFYFVLMGEGIDDCYIDLAERRIRGAFCLNIQDRSTRSLCLNNVFELMDTDDIEDCKGAAWCISRFIEREGVSEEFCDALSNNLSKKDCFENLSLETGDRHFCDEIEGIDGFNCMSELQKSFKDLAADCDNDKFASLFSLFDEDDEFSDTWTGSGLSEDEYSRLRCFLKGIEEVTSKDFYSCESLMDFVESSAEEFPYLKGFMGVYGAIAEQYSDYLIESQVPETECDLLDDGSFHVYRCYDGFEWCKR